MTQRIFVCGTTSKELGEMIDIVEEMLNSEGVQILVADTVDEEEVADVSKCAKTAREHGVTWQEADKISREEGGDV